MTSDGAGRTGEAPEQPEQPDRLEQADQRAQPDRSAQFDPLGFLGAEQESAARLVSVLLGVSAVLCVLLPSLRGVALPRASVELGFALRDAAPAQVLGTTAALAGLFAAARAADRWGVRPALLTALAVLCVGGALLAGSFSGWSFLAGGIVVDAAAAAVLAACLASVPERFLPGRITGVIGSALAALGFGFFVEANLVGRAVGHLGWRALLALVPLAALALLLPALLLLPRAAASARTTASAASVRTAAHAAPTHQDTAYAGAAHPGTVLGGHPGTVLGGAVHGTALVAALILLALGLQLASLWGWSHPAVPAVLGAALVVAVVAHLGGSRHGRGLLPAGVPRSAATATATAAFALGVTQIVLGLAVPPLLLERGVAYWQAALILSTFGLGMAAAALLARRRNYSRLAGSSLGLLVALVALSLLQVLPSGAVAATWDGCALLALTGFGLMLAQVPHLADYLAVLPRRNRAVSAMLYPAAVLLGAIAAQCLPYASSHAYGSAVRGGGNLDNAHLLLQIAILVVAGAAVVLGRPAVALAVVLAGGAQYLLLRGLSGADQADRPEAVTACMAVGAVAGVAAWNRLQQTERLAQSQAAAATLQDAVLHPVPPELGGLRLAGLYRPATVDTGIGGDFYEVMDTPYGVRLLLGDVRGKGVQAVQTVTDLLGGFRSQAHETPELGELVARLDRQLARSAAARADEELFATALVLQYQAPGRAISVINCGHLSPLSVTTDGVRELDVPTRLPLGFGVLGETGPAPQPTLLTLDPGATVVLCTDGLSEARNASGEFYPLTLRLGAALSTTPQGLVHHLDTDVNDWTRHRTDDIAVVALTVQSR